MTHDAIRNMIRRMLIAEGWVQADEVRRIVREEIAAARHPHTPQSPNWPPPYQWPPQC